jgi:hypothetical protein
MSSKRRVHIAHAASLSCVTNYLAWIDGLDPRMRDAHPTTCH